MYGWRRVPLGKDISKKSDVRLKSRKIPKSEYALPNLLDFKMFPGFALIAYFEK